VCDRLLPGINPFGKRAGCNGARSPDSGLVFVPDLDFGDSLAFSIAVCSNRSCPIPIDVIREPQRGNPTSNGTCAIYSKTINSSNLFSRRFPTRKTSLFWTWKVKLSPFLGDSDSLPEHFEQTPNNCRIWKSPRAARANLAPRGASTGS
jgi:hypothetical protein